MQNSLKSFMSDSIELLRTQDRRYVYLACDVKLKLKLHCVHTKKKCKTCAFYL